MPIGVKKLDGGGHSSIANMSAKNGTYICSIALELLSHYHSLLITLDCFYLEAPCLVGINHLGQIIFCLKYAQKYILVCFCLVHG